MRIGVLASHEGSVLQAVLDACADPGTRLRDCVRASASSSATTAIPARSGALACGGDSGAAPCHPRPIRSPRRSTRRSRTSLDDRRTSTSLLLAGYMKRLGPATLARFADRLINTHPSLLPKFGGSGFFGTAVHAAVLAAGERESGATVHWVVGRLRHGANPCAGARA